MRTGALVLLLLASACSERPKPNTPREAVRGFGAGLAEFDYDAMVPYVVGDEVDLEHLRAFCELGLANLAFKTRFLNAYGDDGWAEFNDNAEAKLSIVQNRNLDRFDQVRYEVEGDRAVATLPNDPQKLHLARNDQRWSIRLRESMGFPEPLLRDNTVIYGRMAVLIRAAIPRIGAEGVTPATLDTELAAEMAVVFKEAGRLR